MARGAQMNYQYFPWLAAQLSDQFWTCYSPPIPPPPHCRPSDASLPDQQRIVHLNPKTCESWRRQLTELGSHLASLVQLLKIGLEDARDVFSGGNVQKALCSPIDGGVGGSGRGDCCTDGSGSGAEGQGMRMLDVQADAMRLDADVQSDFVMFIQAFMDRWATAVVFANECPLLYFCFYADPNPYGQEGYYIQQ